MPCYGLGSLHYILPVGSSFSVLGGFQNVPGTNLSFHCHFFGVYVTSVLSIFNVGYGTWKAVDVFEFCHYCHHYPPLWTENNATFYWRQVMPLFWCTILRVFMTDLAYKRFVKADSHIPCRAHAMPCR